MIEDLTEEMIEVHSREMIAVLIEGIKEDIEEVEVEENIMKRPFNITQMKKNLEMMIAVIKNH